LVINSRILEGCRKGQRKYQKKLYEQYYSYGIGICYRYAYSKEDALEILNDSFMKVFNYIGGFNQQYTFLPWFRKIIINTAIDHYKSSRRFYESHILDTIEIEVSDTETIDSLKIDDLMKLLNALPEKYRLTFNLYEIEGYSHEEISEVLNVGISTARSNLARAKKLLRLKYEHYFSETYERIIR